MTSTKARTVTRRPSLIALCAGFGVGSLIAGSMAVPALAAPGQGATAPQPDAASSRALLDRYCVTCHNTRLKTAGLTLDTVDVANIPAGAPIWEKVARKLRAGAMPPPGAPRPDHATSLRLAAWLETAIDLDAALGPRPGRTEAVHRLNRAEYRNAVRDLLDLDVDVAALLPADDMSYGFDNIAGVLKITPSLLDRYMVAARQISRLAVGNPTIAPTAETFRLRADLAQDFSFEELPVGTRGGTAIPYYFPLDAEYVIGVETLAGGTDTHQLEVSIDGERIQLFEVRPRRGRAAAEYEEAAGGLTVRTRVPAGPHVVAVTFVKRTDALAETLREPFLAPHAEGGAAQQPSIASVTITGPYDATGPGDTPARRRIFMCQPADRSEERACATRILASLARRAYRRPVTPADTDTLVEFFDQGRRDSGFDGGIELALRRLLVSPEFLFRVEADPPGIRPNTAYRLSGLELASRLSFFLWSSIPDEELLAAAASGALERPAGLEREVRRMLADPRASALVENFAGQWLFLRPLEGAVPDVYLFPNFGENLRRDFRRETELFFQSLLQEDRRAVELLTADYTFVNERLAKHYGIPDVYGSRFRRVRLTDDNRRGLLGHGSILTVTSLADRTTVVGRGKWILENLLGTPPPAPPPDVPPLPEARTAGRVLTLRERMEQHRANPVCASCHARMDPYGFALENFDATGQWRTLEGAAPVDASAVLPDGTRFEGPAGLRSVLAGESDALVRTLTEKLLIYALGRGLEYYDASAVRAIVRNAAPGGYRLQSLIVGIVQSTPFQMRVSSSTR